MKNKTELVAPAGNLAKLKYALAYGADAVYCGVPEFSLRTRINQFDLNVLKQAVVYAHQQKKKIYVTVNIYAHNQHLAKLESFIKKIKKLGVDGLIAADPGVVAVIKKNWPQARIHLSTQANVTNWQAAKFWYQQGVKRIVLARECTLAEVKEIHFKVPKLELECFVHGAMCMSYSGRCILSKYFTDKSANLGDCTQPCRWQYNLKKRPTADYCLEEVTRPGEFLPYEEDVHGTYILNSKDLCLLEYLSELKRAGVSAFKIEGRAKSLYYLSVVVSVYRQALSDNGKNKKLTVKLINELKKTANRGFTTGFLFGKDKFENNLQSSHSECGWSFVGEVVKREAIDRSDFFWLSVRVHNVLKVGDKIEVIQPDGSVDKLVIEQLINAKNDQELKEAHGGSNQVVKIKSDKDFAVMSLLRKEVKNKKSHLFGFGKC